MVTTVAPLTSIVANVAGDRAEVVGLVPEGTNSHTFDPPPSAAAVLADADVLFINGLQLEEPTKELAEENLPDGASTVELGTQVLPESDYLYDFSFPEEEGKPNPHLWTEPDVRAAVRRAGRDHPSRRSTRRGASTYEENLAAFTRKVDALDAALRADQESRARGGPRAADPTTTPTPTSRRRTAGGSSARCSPRTSRTPTPQDVADIIDQVRAEDVKAVFGSEVFPSPVLEQISRETGAAYVDVLRDDDLPGEPGDPEHSWLGLMRFDYVTMIEALGGTAPTLEALDVSDVVTDTADYPQ